MARERRRDARTSSQINDALRAPRPLPAGRALNHQRARLEVTWAELTRTAQRRGACAAILTGMLLPATAPAAPHAPVVTGAQFVRDMLGSPDDGNAYLARERVVGYVEGIRDGTVGVRWCPAGQQVTHEIAFVAAEEIKKLPTEQRNGAAAPLILAVLSKHFPCPSKGAK